MLLFVKLLVALPVFVTLLTLVGERSLHPLVQGCFGFTAYMLADVAVSVWISRKEGL